MLREPDRSVVWTSLWRIASFSTFVFSSSSSTLVWLVVAICDPAEVTLDTFEDYDHERPTAKEV